MYLRIFCNILFQTRKVSSLKKTLFFYHAQILVNLIKKSSLGAKKNILSAVIQHLFHKDNTNTDKRNIYIFKMQIFAIQKV